MSLTVEVRNQTACKHLGTLRRALRRAHRILRPGLRELSVAVVDDARMAELHERYLGIARPTDVLTFELDTDARGRATEGEVVVCLDEARRQARRRRHAVASELLLYALHGMLHLCGFDDKSHAGFAEMHRAEDDILGRIGMGSVFARPARKRARPEPATKGRRR